jgi:hypothetical protein
VSLLLGNQQGIGHMFNAGASAPPFRPDRLREGTPLRTKLRPIVGFRSIAVSNLSARSFLSRFDHTETLTVANAWTDAR